LTELFAKVEPQLSRPAAIIKNTAKPNPTAVTIPSNVLRFITILSLYVQLLNIRTVNREVSY
jgi:hypothetical protein